ncbi:MAG: hypothetical protein P1U87_20270 [Verrucomicrobiales bacterium]|nr:hypothetical protein [Verrucomicrobiales bacterium]
MAIRYDQKTKDEVVSFIQNYNEENGRGGQSAAAKKWKLNPITVKAWMEKAGLSSPGKSGKKKKKNRPAKASAPAPRKANSAPKNVSAILKRMVQVQEQIEGLQSEYNSLKFSL